jgi:tetratricopeptide (TPR) repeat protein
MVEKEKIYRLIKSVLLGLVPLLMLLGCGGKTVVVRHREDFLKKGFSALEMGKPESAIDYFRQALAGDPENPQAMYGLGRAYLSRRDTYRAEQFLRQAIAKRPDYPEVHALLGELAMSRGDEKGALEHFAKCPSGTPAWAELQFRLGKDKLDKGDKEGAKRDFELARSVPSFWGGHYGQGEIIRQDVGCKEALPYFVRALRLKEAPEVLISAAECLKDSGRDKEAYFFYLRYLALAAERPKTKEARILCDRLTLCMAHCETVPKLTFDATKEEDVRVAVYDEEGRFVKNLFTGRITRGKFIMNWDGSDSLGIPVKGHSFFGVVVCGDSTSINRLSPNLP